MDLRQVEAAARAIGRAQALFIAAGAGMGVDSGLPDFRGDEGFWRAYPPFRKLGLDFRTLANPRWFDEDPALAWGFYGHRLRLYRETRPHAGFEILRRWGEAKPEGFFVFTTNVDGQFQRAGFPEDRIEEHHGSIHHAQCLAGCDAGLFAADFEVDLDPETMRARPPLPACPSCGALARPNILMFGDAGWDESRAAPQEARRRRWLRGVEGELAIVECGAGTGVPTVRMLCESLAEEPGVTLVRINAREPEVPRGHVGIAGGALEVLRAIDARLQAAPTGP